MATVIRSLVFAAFAMTSIVVRAQNTMWQIDYTPYAWLAAIKSDADVQEPPENGGGSGEQTSLLDILEKAYMHKLHVKYGRWGVINEVIYLDTYDQRYQTTPFVKRIETSASLLATDLGGSYKLSANSWLLMGARRIRTDVHLAIHPPLGLPVQQLSLDETWTSPMLGIRCRWPAASRWSLEGQADYASSGDEATSYMLTGELHFRINKHLAVKAGYRYAGLAVASSIIDMDYTLTGGLLGLGLRW